MHVYIQGVYVTKLKAIEIRDTFYQSETYTHFLEEYNVVDRACIDDLVMPIGKNGLVLISDRKPGRLTGYHVFFIGQTDGLDWKTTSILSKNEGDALLPSHISEIYNFIFEKQFWPEIGYAQKVRNVISKTQYHSKNKEFNLAEFLTATSGWIPKYEKYFRIMCFLVSIKYPKDKAVELLNAAWKPSNPLETAAKYDSISEEDSVTKGTMIHYLQKHGTNVNYSKIFPQKMKNRVHVYYNQYRDMLLGRPVFMREIESYFTDMLVFIYGDKMYSYRYFVDEYDKYNNCYRRIVTKITKHPPFFAKETFDITVHPTLEDITMSCSKNGQKKRTYRRNARSYCQNKGRAPDR